MAATLVLTLHRHQRQSGADLALLSRYCKHLRIGLRHCCWASTLKSQSRLRDTAKSLVRVGSVKIPLGDTLTACAESSQSAFPVLTDVDAPGFAGSRPSPALRLPPLCVGSAKLPFGNTHTAFVQSSQRAILVVIDSDATGSAGWTPSPAPAGWTLSPALGLHVPALGLRALLCLRACALGLNVSQKSGARLYSLPFQASCASGVVSKLLSMPRGERRIVPGGSSRACRYLV